MRVFLWNQRSTLHRAQLRRTLLLHVQASSKITSPHPVFVFTLCAFRYICRFMVLTYDVFDTVDQLPTYWNDLLPADSGLRSEQLAIFEKADLVFDWIRLDAAQNRFGKVMIINFWFSQS